MAPTALSDVRAQTSEAEAAAETAKQRRLQVPRLAETLRQAKRRLLKGDGGAPSLPGCDRGEVEDFDALLEAVDWCGERMSEAFALLKAAPGPLLECLKRQGVQQGVEEEPLVKKLDAELTNCFSRVCEGEHHVEAMRSLAQELRATAARARAAFPERDAAWAAKAHYDAKVERLRNDPARTGPSFVIEAQVSRNKSKQETTNAAFQAATLLIRKEAGGLLAARQANTAELLSDLCRCHAVAFGVPDLDELGESLAAKASELKAAVPELEVGTHPLTTMAAVTELGMLMSPSNQTAGAYKYRQGDRLQVKSSSGRSWLDGIVEEVFGEAADVDGRAVAAGTFRISSSEGVQYVQPDEAPASLRAPEDASSCVFAKGDEVEVWSNSQKAWLEGLVCEVFTNASIDTSGFVVAAGSVKVTFGESMKFVVAEQVKTSIRLRTSSAKQSQGAAVEG